VGPCLCVTLCAELPPTDDEDDEPMPGVWTKVGDAFTIPPVLGPAQTFDADGYAGTAKYAIHGQPRLLGSAPRTRNGHPVEYRFLVSDTTTPNGGAPPPAAAFTRVVGAAPNENLFSPVDIGQLIKIELSPFSISILNVEAQLGDLDPDGWLDVNVSITRTFNDAGIPAADRPNYKWVDLDALMAINTHALTTEPDVPGGAAGPGDSVPAGNFISIEKVAVRFEIREVINKGANLFAPFPASGTTLNAMIINNNQSVMELAMTEHLASTACNTLSGPVHVAYTLYHPHLRSASIHIRSNDGSINTGLADAGPPALPLAGNTNPAVVHAFNSALSVNPPLTLHRCTYIVTLNVRRRLHNGDDAVPNQHIQTSFFWEP
jgi:hypothetical protein